MPRVVSGTLSDATEDIFSVVVPCFDRDSVVKTLVVEVAVVLVVEVGVGVIGIPVVRERQAQPEQSQLSLTQYSKIRKYRQRNNARSPLQRTTPIENKTRFH